MLISPTRFGLKSFPPIQLHVFRDPVKMDYVLSVQIKKELLERLQVLSIEKGARLESAQTTTWEQRGFVLI